MPRLNPFARSTVSITKLWQADLGDHVISLAWAPDGKSLAAAAIGGPIALLDAASGKIQHTMKGHGLGTCAVAWSAQGQHLASAGQDGKVRLWDPATGLEKKALTGGAAWVEHVAWSPKLDLLASAAGKKLRLWNHEGELVREYPDHASTIADIQWKQGDDVLASAAYGQLTLWSPAQQEPVQRLEWKGSILAIAWSPTGTHIATGDQDNTVHFWILKTGEDLMMSGYPTKVREVSWDPTGRYLATGGGTVPCVWDCSGKGPAGRAPLQLEAHTELVTALEFQKKGPWLLSGGADGLIALWHPGKLEGTLALEGLKSPITQLHWGPSDQQFAVGTDGGTVAVYGVK